MGSDSKLVKLTKRLNEAVAELKKLEGEKSELEKSLAKSIEVYNGKVSEAITASQKSHELYIKGMDKNIKDPLWKRWPKHILQTLKDMIDRFLSSTWGEVVKYIVFICVIGLCAGVGIAMTMPSTDTIKTGSRENTSGLTKEEKEKVQARIDSQKSSFERVRERIRDFFASFSSLFDFGYRFRAVFKSFAQFKEQTTDRERYYSGRCDNVTMVQASGGGSVGLVNTDGKAGFCVSSTIPLPIVWDIEKDLSKKSHADIHRLPDSVKSKLEYEHKKIVRIPYTTSTVNNLGSFYVPQCDAAYYINAAGEKIPIDLLTNNGYVSCGLKRTPTVVKSANDASQPRTTDRSAYCPV